MSYTLVVGMWGGIYPALVLKKLVNQSIVAQAVAYLDSDVLQGFLNHLAFGKLVFRSFCYRENLVQ